MAVAIYTTDLTTLAIGDEVNDPGTWDESSDASWDDGGTMVDDQNLYYINTECVSAQFTKTGQGTILYDHGSAITVPTDGAILLHHLWAAPPALSTYAAGGVCFFVGDSFGNLKIYYVSGSDKAPAPEGGWATYAVDPAQTHQAFIGTLPTTWSVIGGGIKATLQARGNPHACQAIRYGRCEQIYTVGALATPAVFSGYAAVDSANTARYNLLQPISGGYQARGLISLGQAATSVYFVDANVNIYFADDSRVSANFNAIEINHASSTVKWTNISFTALGTTSKGSLNMIDDTPFEDNGGVFTDMGTFIYDSNYTGVGRTWRRCGLVTQGGSTMTDCIFDEASGVVALLADIIGDVTGCSFVSDGTGHAVNLGTIGSTQSMAWDNTDTGYASSDGSTGNETILVSVSSGFTLTINVSATATTPTIYNTGAGTVSVVAGQKTFKFTLSPSLTNYEWRLYSITAVGSLDGATELDGEEDATADNQSYAYSYSSDQPIAVQIINQPDNDYVESITYYTLVNNDQDVTILLTKDINN